MTDPSTEPGFARRHLGPGPADLAPMLEAVGVGSLDQLIDETIPDAIRLRTPLNLPAPESEDRYLRRLRALASRNRVLTSCIGLGYYDCITPSVILRNVMENPGWYTPYTPYQAEIAQGRLEALLNFQTMVQDLTGMEAANASLLDEATAAAEAMTMLHRIQNRRARARERRVFLASAGCFPQTLEVLGTRAEPLGIDLRDRGSAGDAFTPGGLRPPAAEPGRRGRACTTSHPSSRPPMTQDILVAVATDLLALTLVRPPGEMGADVALGSAQRFGVPMGYGGPHAAFFAARRAVRARDAGAHHRGVGGQRRAARLPHGPADARAAHPAGEGQVQHLHRPGPARQHGRVLRGVPRPRRPARDRRPRCTGWPANSRRPRRAWGTARRIPALLRHPVPGHR